jgi:2'-5' RNA ligase
VANPTGIFVIAELTGELADQVAAIQHANDRHLAALWPPHVTLIGSSGAGPILANTSIDTLRTTLGAVANRTAPMRLMFGPPHRFPDRDIVVLPLDPHGPIRALHEQLMLSVGVRNMFPARYPFTPHCTLTMFPALSRARAQRLLGIRVTHPLIIDRLRVLLTREPHPAKLLLELPLGGTSVTSAT